MTIRPNNPAGFLACREKNVEKLMVKLKKSIRRYLKKRILVPARLKLRISHQDTTGLLIVYLLDIFI